MSTDSGHILVTFGAIAGAEADTASTSAALNQQLADLRGYLAPLVASWDGVARDAYQRYQNEWNQALTELNGVLSQVSAALGVAHDNYQQAEQANTSMWPA
jgi:WXG100 family type VII secretion target